MIYEAKTAATSSLRSISPPFIVQVQIGIESILVQMEHNPTAHNGELILIPEHCEEHKETSTQRRLAGAQLIDVHESFMVRTMGQERERVEK